MYIIYDDKNDVKIVSIPCKLEKLKKSAGNEVFLWLDDFIKKLSL